MRNKVIKFRFHCGGLEKSMASYKEFTNIADMLNYISEKYDGLVKPEDISIGKSYGLDDRIGWKSWRYVCTERFGEKFSYFGTPQCIGMCDLGENDDNDE